MNNKISFESALLLKSKGFNEKVRGRYVIEDSNVSLKKGMFFYSDYDLAAYCVYAPTISEILEWLLKEYKLWVIANVTVDEEWRWYFEIYDLKSKRNAEIPTEELYYNSHIDAYMAGIEFCLNNIN